MKTNPLTVNVLRGSVVESSHAVHGVVMDRVGDVVDCWGDQARMVLPRSSLKPLQAISLVESGALDAFGLGAQELALACASHNAEAVHMDAVRAWLAKIGLGEDALACGGHLSINTGRANEMIRNDEKLTGIYSDCSGKHAGMLTTAMHLGVDPHGYEQRDHPVQKLIFETISDMTGHDLAHGQWGRDGCSVPNPAIPLAALARGFARFLQPEELPEGRAAACTRILDAMGEHPYMVGGAERFDTVLIEATNGNVVSKLGAEGNYVAFIRDKGLVIYLKTEDGVTQRATLPVLGALLNRYNALDNAADEAIAEFTRPVLKNWSGLETGKITVPELG